MSEISIANASPNFAALLETAARVEHFSPAAIFCDQIAAARQIGLESFLAQAWAGNTHLNYSDNIRMVEKPAGKDEHVVAGWESNSEVSRWQPSPTLPQDLKSHRLLPTYLVSRDISFLDTSPKSLTS